MCETLLPGSYAQRGQAIFAVGCTHPCGDFLIDHLRLFLLAWHGWCQDFRRTSLSEGKPSSSDLSIAAMLVSLQLESIDVRLVLFWAGVLFASDCLPGFAFSPPPQPLWEIHTLPDKGFACLFCYGEAQRTGCPSALF